MVDRGANAIEKLTRATPAVLSFATTPEGSTSSDSPQTVTLGNDGNAALVLSGLSTASSSFTLSGSSTCTSSTNRGKQRLLHHRRELCADGPWQPVDRCRINLGQQPERSGGSAVSPVERHRHAAERDRDSCTGKHQLHSRSDGAIGDGCVSGCDCAKWNGELHHRWRKCCSGNLHGVIFAIDLHSELPDGTLSATTHTITATLASDTDFASASGSAALTVTAIAPTITFTVPNHTYGDAPVTLAATSNSGAAITYSVVSGPATYLDPH